MSNPKLDLAFRKRYVGRPQDLAKVRATAKAWEILKQISTEPSPYMREKSDEDRDNRP